MKYFSIPEIFQSTNFAIPGLALGSLILATIYWLYQRAFPRPLPGIPYDVLAAKSIQGDVITLRNDPEGLAKWCSKHLEKLGSPVCQVMMGPYSKPVVLVADVGETRDIMMRSDFDRSAYIIDRFCLFGGSQILMHTNEQWRNSRGWLKDLLTPQYMQTVAGPAIHHSVGQLLELWDVSSRVAGPKKPFSMLQDLKNLALDVMTQFHHGDEFQDLALTRQLQFAQGLDPKALEAGPDNEVTLPRAPMNIFGEGVTEIGDRMAAIYVMASPPWLVSLWTKYFMAPYRRWFAAKESVMRERFRTALKRLRAGHGQRNAIDYMVMREEKAAEKAGRRPLYEDQIMIDEVGDLKFSFSSLTVEQAFGNHIAGLHTTSSALVWICKYLTENPEIQTKVRKELQAAFPVAVRESYRLPTTSELMLVKLPYVEAVVEETMRLRAAFLIARDTVRDTELLGYRIPKGTVCLLVCQGIKHFTNIQSKSDKPSRRYPGQERMNPDLESFDPERWLHRNGTEVKFDQSSNSQMAFGLGIRACWGRKLAELEMKMFTALVAWNFDLLPIPQALMSHEAVYDFSYRAKKGFLQLRKRSGPENKVSSLLQ